MKILHTYIDSLPHILPGKLHAIVVFNWNISFKMLTLNGITIKFFHKKSLGAGGTDETRVAQHW